MTHNLTPEQAATKLSKYMTTKVKKLIPNNPGQCSGKFNKKQVDCLVATFNIIHDEMSKSL